MRVGQEAEEKEEKESKSQWSSSRRRAGFKQNKELGTRKTSKFEPPRSLRW